VVSARVGDKNGVAVASRNLAAAVADDFGFDPPVANAISGLLCQGAPASSAGLSRPTSPDCRFVDAVGPQEIWGRVRTINLESVVPTAMVHGESEVVEHSFGVQ
jgi:hypothetical protein